MASTRLSDDDFSSSSEGEDSESVNDTKSAANSKASSTAGKTGKNVAGENGEDTAVKVKNDLFDEAVDLSESGSSFEMAPSPSRKVKNQPFDEALDLSGSLSDDSVSEAEEGRAGKSEDKSSTGASTAPSPSLSRPEVSARPATRSGGRGQRQSQGEELEDTIQDKTVKNKPFDEQFDLSGSDSESSLNTDDEKISDGARKTVAVEVSKPAATSTPSKEAQASSPGEASSASDGEDDEDEEDDDESNDSDLLSGSSDGESEGESPVKKSTKTSKGSASSSASSGAKAKASVPLSISDVPPEVSKLFELVGAYTPQEVELEATLRCFLPDYIPAIGQIDAFLKVPRPDGLEPSQRLGVTVLDEPCAGGSDPTALELQLRASSKKSHPEAAVRSIEDAHKNPAEIQRWIRRVEELHRNKPPPQVHYTRPMPDVEALMQVWPEKMEDALGRSPLALSKLDMSLEERVRVICALLDIPVYDNIIESMHLFVSLYAEFSANQHFVNIANRDRESGKQVDTSAHAKHMEQLRQPSPIESGEFSD